MTFTDTSHISKALLNIKRIHFLEIDNIFISLEKTSIFFLNQNDYTNILKNTSVTKLPI